MRWKPSGSWSLALSLLAAGAAAQAAEAPSLEGVWGGTRIFGPAVQGRLEIARVNGAWRARIGPHDVPVTARDGRLVFELPGGAGRFSGRAGGDGEPIEGHWVQPPTVNDGARLATPVALAPRGKGRWQGEVVPLPDEFTFYLVISRKPDGSLGAFIRNPDRNIGISWDVQRVVQQGSRVRLLGQLRGRGGEVLLGEGEHHPSERRLSLHFPSRGGTFDLVPVAGEPGPGFSARGEPPPPYEYRPPPPGDDGWRVGTLDEAGMSAGPIAELVRAASVPATSVGTPDIHAVLVARRGRLVVEEYFHGFHRDRPHDTRSAAKSLTATLLGAVMQAGGTKLGPSTRVYDVLGPPRAEPDPRKLQMTVEHLLTMSSGYDCDDSSGDRPGSEDRLQDEDPGRDYYRYTLDLPMENAPGQQGVYCSIDPNLLGGVIGAAARRPLEGLFHELIARPLQMGRYHLVLQPTGEPYMGGGVKLLPRDFIKLGQLMLDGGAWNGRRIVSRDFAARATSPLLQLRGQRWGMRYGYLWWTTEYPHQGKTLRAYFASGNGGQVAVVIPELELVVAAFGGNYADRTSGWTMVRELIPQYILPAVRNVGARQ